MEEAFVALGVFGALLHRQQGIELLPYEYGIAHLALGGAWMHVATLDMDLGGCGIEVLEFQFAGLTAVHGIGIDSVELLNVELDHSAADFLIGSESYADGAMLEFRMGHDILHRIHYLGHAGLVIGAEKSGAIGGDDGLALMAEQFRELGRFQKEPRNTFQRDVGTVVVLDYLRFDILAGGVGGGVHVGDEAYRGHILLYIRGDAAHNVAVFIEFRLYSKVIQFLAKEFQEVQLLGCRGLALRLLVALGIDRHVPQESVQDLFHLYLF